MVLGTLSPFTFFARRAITSPVVKQFITGVGMQIATERVGNYFFAQKSKNNTTTGPTINPQPKLQK